MANEDVPQILLAPEANNASPPVYDNSFEAINEGRQYRQFCDKKVHLDQSRKDGGWMSTGESCALRCFNNKDCELSNWKARLSDETGKSHWPTTENVLKDYRWCTKRYGGGTYAGRDEWGYCTRVGEKHHFVKYNESCEEHSDCHPKPGELEGTCGWPAYTCNKHW